jgi:colanic acid biosynthesis glycosyl transferase WcaI
LRILLLTQWFDPEPTFKGLLFAQKLQELGHEVEVVTGFPNYPEGKIYAGYRQSWCHRESIGGVRIARVPLYASHDSSALKRLLNYFSFALSSSLYGIFMARKADIIYVYHPPMTVGVAGALIGWFRRTPFVYDIQDLWPDTLKATGMIGNPRILSVAGAVCNWIYRRASHIVVLSPGFRSLLAERGVPEKKMSLIYNWCDETGLQAPVGGGADLSFMNGRFNVVFAGNMGKAQALEAVIAAAQLVAAEESRVQFVLVGGGVEVENLKALCARSNLQNLRFVPRMPMNEVGEVLARADALLVHLKDDPLFSITIPSKTQAYLAVGRPIIMAVRGDAADLVREAEAGVVAIPEDPESIAQGVLQLARLPLPVRETMGQKAAQFYKNKLSLSVGVAAFIKVFEHVLFSKKNAGK